MEGAGRQGCGYHGGRSGVKPLLFARTGGVWPTKRAITQKKACGTPEVPI